MYKKITVRLFEYDAGPGLVSAIDLCSNLVLDD